MNRCAVPGCDCIAHDVAGLCRRHYQALPFNVRDGLWKAHRAFRDSAPQYEEHNKHVYAVLAEKAAQSLAPEVVQA